MLRVTTGTAKNKKLEIPEIEGFRAVQEKAKQAVFSILEDRIEGAACLDLFAGSGNLGIEALSRGAESCDFVDENPTSVEIIVKNLTNTGLLEHAEVFRRSVVKYVVNTDRTYDVVFADPFYHDTALVHLFKNLGNILNKNGVIAFFHGDQLDISKMIAGTELKIRVSRKFGLSKVTILEK
ncbi:16S rRNA (guanine(966)-N(2))-methyltransferase RsmD [candidate division WWE3 bacterium RIFOXYD1_FULL_39_9]|uniref:16S rRNA (Guanine(966)-N(2))-methyltransferase RsmD n=2 Tax=Katanobacteria TaxID=422282 RepID=A0A1F4X9B6_UNCKA|nr:MAG: 16S rRNA (guanine(966)-N(2))-methyltransferase RsmD [candidate division WWE3 bacterium RIFOXYD1_FULL_39_9]